ncbi:MAG: aldo/keto reductase [Treponema sp.]|nr:aldo/keto reductase [Treponema sp.]
MNYRNYGKLGYQVSALGMGCMRLPRVYKDGESKAEIDKEKAIEIIRYAVEHGINYFDTAFTYHNQTSEIVLGEALKGGYREKVKVVTKQPLGVMKTQDDIRINLESTLKKLQTDYIDVYLIHNIQKGNWEEVKKREIVREWEKFRDEGLIKAIAFSYHGKFPCFNEVMEYYPWDMCQVQQNLLDIDKEVTAESIRVAGEKGCALVIMEPLRGGGLVNTPPSVKAAYDTWPEERSPAEWAFRHLIDYPEVSCIISGMTTLEQLKENIAIFSKPDAVPGCLTTKEREILAKVKDAYDSIISIPCTSCGYCMPCPHGVDIVEVFYRYNEGMMFSAFDQPRRMYAFSDKGGRGARSCTDCGECVKKCPQSIDIPKELKIAHKALAGWIE